MTVAYNDNLSADFGYILKTEPIEYPDVLAVDCEKKKSQR